MHPLCLLGQLDAEGRMTLLFAVDGFRVGAKNAPRQKKLALVLKQCCSQSVKA